MRSAAVARFVRLTGASVVALAVTVVVALVAPGIARASCATVNVSPQDAPVGTIVTARASLTGGGNCGDPSDVYWNQGGVNPATSPYGIFTAVSGCGKGETTCVLRVHYDAGARTGFVPFCLDGAGWSECDSITIEGALVTGTVMNNDPGHRPAPVVGAVVEGSGEYASFNTFDRTNAKGVYSLELPGGDSIISAGKLYGEYRTANPDAVHWRYTYGTGEHKVVGRPALNTEVVDIKGDITNLDFDTASCSATHTCPLKVYVRVLGTLRSGLGFSSDFPKGGPVKFTIPTTSALFTEPYSTGQRCKSGCVNLLVGVVDPQIHANVADATVDASVSDGVGFLCYPLVEEKLRCDTTLKGLKTDKNGKLHLLYWTPGESTPESTQLSITATSPTCTDASCPTPFTQTTTVTVMPYPIYTVENAELGSDEVALLVEMARSSGLGGLLQEVAGHTAADEALAALIMRGERWFVQGSTDAIAAAGRAGEYAAEGLTQAEQEAIVATGRTAEYNAELLEQAEGAIKGIS